MTTADGSASDPEPASPPAVGTVTPPAVEIPAVESAAVVRVRAVLAAAGARGQIRTLAVSAATAQAAADQIGCPVGAIANSLVFLARSGTGEEPVLIMTSGAHRVDTAQVAAILDVDAVERADPATMRSVTGMVIGGVAPVGHPTPLRTLVDIDLGQFDRIWAAAGHPHTVFDTSYEELLRLTGGVAAEVAG